MPSSRRRFLQSSAGILGLASSLPAWTKVGSAAPATRHFRRFDRQARALLRRMNLADKIGQMMQINVDALKDHQDITRFRMGGILCGGDQQPKAGATLQDWTANYESCQEAALKMPLRIPVMYGLDMVHGCDKYQGGVVFPHNVGLGCANNPELMVRYGRVTAKETRAAGVNWVFSPCLAVPQDIRWGRSYEGFSESPQIVGSLGAAVVRGLQDQNLAGPASVAACVKHFAGDGGTVFGTGRHLGPGTKHAPLDQGDARYHDADFMRLFVDPYRQAIAEGAATVMPSYSSWNGVKCSADRLLLTGILKQQLGFDGFTISDWQALNELPGTYVEQVATSINAGMDMIMVPNDYVGFAKAMHEAIDRGRIPMARIDDAVFRILRVKMAMGLLDDGSDLRPLPSLVHNFGSPEHRAVARQCARESLVLLKNDGNLLPLRTGGRIHVTGKSADNLGNQCGGWTMSWQGKSGNQVDTGGTTILTAIRKAAGHATVTYAEDGSGVEGAALAIAVIGETPYAEFFGDRDSLPLDPADVALVQRLKRAGVPVLVVLVSGRPLYLDPILNEADAIVAAWLPGTEGDGVADVLFGAFQPKGKLSFTWPKASSTSLNRQDPGYQTLYPLGYGLT